MNAAARPATLVVSRIAHLREAFAACGVAEGSWIAWHGDTSTPDAQRALDAVIEPPAALYDELRHHWGTENG